MQSNYHSMSSDQKLALMRAFYVLKQMPEFNRVLNFLEECDQEVARNLRTLPIEQIQIEQGKAQILEAIFQLVDMADQTNLKTLENTVNGSMAHSRTPNY